MFIFQMSVNVRGQLFSFMSNTVQETLTQMADRHEYLIKQAIELANSAHVRVANLAHSGGQSTTTDGHNATSGTPTQTDLPNSGGDLPASAPSPATTESETVRQLRARISELEARNTTPVAGEQLQHPEQDDALADSIPQVDAEFCVTASKKWIQVRRCSIVNKKIS